MIRRLKDLNIPHNRPLIHISLGWGLWSVQSFKVKSHKMRNLKMEVGRKSLFSISRPNVDGFRISKHLLKGLLMPVKIRYCKPKSMHFWQQGGLGNVDRLVRDTLALDLKCNRCDGDEKSQNSKCPKKFLLDILVKSQWILAYDTAFERSQYPPKSTFNTYLSGMRPLVRAAFQSSEVWCAAFFRLPWGKFNFLKPVRATAPVF